MSARKGNDTNLTNAILPLLSFLFQREDEEGAMRRETCRTVINSSTARTINEIKQTEKKLVKVSKIALLSGGTNSLSLNLARKQSCAATSKQTKNGKQPFQVPRDLTLF